MTHSKFATCVLTVGFGLAFGAMAHPTHKHPVAETEIEVADPTEMKTAGHKDGHVHPKPGASVTFSSEVSGPIAAGGPSFVEIQIKEYYPAGSMTLEARSTDGIEVYGAGRSVRKDMSESGLHSWRVDFRAGEDGVYYIPIVATVTPDAGLEQFRSYAVRVEVGDWKMVKDAKEAGKPMAAQADGEMAFIMQAEETIE